MCEFIYSFKVVQTFPNGTFDCPQQSDYNATLRNGLFTISVSNPLLTNVYKMVTHRHTHTHNKNSAAAAELLLSVCV